MEETGNLYNAIDELQGGEGKEAWRKWGAGSKGGGHRSLQKSGKMKSLCKTVYEEFVREELFAIRKIITHNSLRKRCKQSLGRCVYAWKEKRHL